MYHVNKDEGREKEEPQMREKRREKQQIGQRDEHYPEIRQKSQASKACSMLRTHHLGGLSSHESDGEWTSGLTGHRGTVARG